MFKTLLIYRVLAGWPADPGVLGAALEQAQFTECGPTQERSAGWIEPRGHAYGSMVEVIDNQWLLKLMVETKAVPTDVLRRKVQEQCDQIEASTGRRPGKKRAQGDCRRGASIAAAHGICQAVRIASVG